VTYLYPVRNTLINDVRKQALSVNYIVSEMKKAPNGGKNFVIIDYSQNQSYNGTMGGSDDTKLAQLKDNGAVVWGSDSQIVQGRTNIKYNNGLFTDTLLGELNAGKDIDDLKDKVEEEVSKQARERGVKYTDKMYLPQTEKYSGR